jgi:hemerythrin
MAIEWKEGFAIGVNEIDNQHQVLFARLDLLWQAMKEGKEAKEVAELLQFLSDYARDHFRVEEAMQERFEYPHLALQREEHRYFLKRLAGLRERLDAEGPTPEVAKLASQFAYQWLVSHICRVDRVLGDFVNANRNPEWEEWLKNNF